MTKHLSKIARLFAELCPKGVDFRELGDTDYFTLTMGQSPDGMSVNADEKGVEFHQGKTNFTRFIIANSGQYTSKPSKLAKANSVLMRVRAPVGAVSYTDRSICIGRGLCAIQTTNKVSSMYLYYVMQILGEELAGRSSGSTFASTNANNVKAVKIPVPPLAVQQEIVKILDNFTELEAELEARKKQYEHYRTDLLTFGDKVDWKMLGVVGKFLRGTAITAKETSLGEIPVIANAPGSIYFHNKSNRSGETIVIARSGAYAGLISFWNQPIFLTDAFSAHLDDALLKAKFVYYLLKQKQETIHSMKKGSGVPHVRVKDFESYSIPIPPLAEQEHIVSILDKFDALVNDIW